MLKNPIYHEYDLESRSFTRLLTVSHVEDHSTEIIELRLMQHGEQQVIPADSSITARFVETKNNILISDNVVCTVNELGDIMIPFDNAVIASRSGEMKIEVCIEKEAEILTLQFPLMIRVNPSILDDAEVTPESEGTIRELLDEAKAELERVQGYVDEEQVLDILDDTLGAIPTARPTLLLDNNHPSGDYFLYSIDSKNVRHNIGHLDVMQHASTDDNSIDNCDNIKVMYDGVLHPAGLGPEYAGHYKVVCVGTSPQNKAQFAISDSGRRIFRRSVSASFVGTEWADVNDVAIEEIKALIPDVSGKENISNKATSVSLDAEITEEDSVKYTSVKTLKNLFRIVRDNLLPLKAEQAQFEDLSDSFEDLNSADGYHLSERAEWEAGGVDNYDKSITTPDRRTKYIEISDIFENISFSIDDRSVWKYRVVFVDETKSTVVSIIPWGINATTVDLPLIDGNTGKQAKYFRIVFGKIDNSGAAAGDEVHIHALAKSRIISKLERIAASDILVYFAGGNLPTITDGSNGVITVALANDSNNKNLIIYDGVSERSFTAAEILTKAAEYGLTTDSSARTFSGNVFKLVYNYESREISFKNPYSAIGQCEIELLTRMYTSYIGGRIYDMITEKTAKIDHQTVVAMYSTVQNNSELIGEVAEGLGDTEALQTALSKKVESLGVLDYWDDVDVLEGAVWVKGSVNPTTGTKVNSEISIRTGVVEVPDNVSEIRFSCESGWKYFAVALNGTQTDFTVVEFIDWTVNPTVLNVDAVKAKYIRVVLGKLDNSVIDTSAASNISTKVKTLLVSEVLKNRLNIPSCFIPQLKAVKENVKADLRSAGRNAESFAFITDVHWEGNYKHSPDLLKELAQDGLINLIVCGGDLIDGGAETSKKLALLSDCVQAFCKVGVPFITAVGNHDLNSGSGAAYRFSNNEYFAAAQHPSANERITYGGDFNFYFDRFSTKTRFIVVYSGVNYIDNISITNNQISWVENVVNNTPSDYHIIVIVHALGEYIEDEDHGEYMIDEGDVTESTKKYKFSEITGASNFLTRLNALHAQHQVEAVFFGHTHYDADSTTSELFEVGSNGIPVISTNSDSKWQYYDMTEPKDNTVESQCFDIVTIDYESKKISMRRVGRGADREILYS